MTRYAILIIMLLIVGVVSAQTEPPIEPPPDAPGATATYNPREPSICYTFECTRTPAPTHPPTGTPSVHICNTFECTPTVTIAPPVATDTIAPTLTWIPTPIPRRCEHTPGKRGIWRLIWQLRCWINLTNP